jgi:hypothetical protein
VNPCEEECRFRVTVGLKPDDLAALSSTAARMTGIARTRPDGRHRYEEPAAPGDAAVAIQLSLSPAQNVAGHTTVSYPEPIGEVHLKRKWSARLKLCGRCT